MEEYKKYQHIEKLGSDEVDGILLGKTYIFYKIDGTNGKIWFENGEIKFGSRNRVLSLDTDNAGFMLKMSQDERIIKFFNKYPNYILFGEWLVPHTLKTYKTDSWRKFYVFDVCECLKERLPSGENFKYINYDVYKPILEEFKIDYIPAIAIGNNITEKQCEKLLEKTGDFLVEQGKGYGEGIVIKNYDYKNKYGRQTWAKIVLGEFKIKNAKAFGSCVIGGESTTEQKIIDKFLSVDFIEKEYNKIIIEMNGWHSKFIPMLFGKCWFEFIKDNINLILKEFKMPKIDFSILNKLMIIKIKEFKKILF